MFEKILKLGNGKYVGCNVFEVSSVPTNKMISDDEKNSFDIVGSSRNFIKFATLMKLLLKFYG